MAGELHIGYDRKEKNKHTILPLNALKRHFAAIGASGSGKTVLVKCIMEECIRAGVPLLMVDLQGDLASLALMGDKKQVEKKGTPGEYWDEVERKAEVAIFTPASSKGIPISMNPLKAPPDKLDPEDFIQAVDSVADTVASILGYKTDKGKGSEVKDYLYLLLEAIWQRGQAVETFDKLADYINNDSSILDESARAMIKDKDKADLAKSVKGMTIGAESLLFNLGMALDVERMMTWSDVDRVPVNILYLNTLRDRDDKVNFIADIANQVYNWMLRNPSTKVQLVFVLDELAGLVPPIRNPPSKRAIQLLLKQSRKYGVSLLLATQNISDVDYKSLGQVSTWALGKLIARQDIAKVKDIIQAISPSETDEILSILPKQQVGQFMLLNPDVYDSVQRIQARWLVTNHSTLDDGKVKEILDKTGIREKFPDAKGKTREYMSAEEGRGSPLTADQIEGIDIEEDEGDVDPDLTIPDVRDVKEILPTMDESPLALSAEEISARTGEDQEEIAKELDELVKSDKLESEMISGIKIYWSKKHKMDPKNNIVGPLYEIRNNIAEGIANNTMQKNMSSVWGRGKDEYIKDQKFKYIPLWKVSAEKKVKEGGFLGLGGKEKTVSKPYFINGLNGTVLHYSEKEDKLDFLSRSFDPNEVESFPSDVIKVKITTEDLTSEFLKPKINREEAKKRVVRALAFNINKKEIPALYWMPIWEFTVEDKIMKDTERKAWIDGYIGTLIADDVL